MISSLRNYAEFCPVELADITFQDFPKKHSTEDVRAHFDITFVLPPTVRPLSSLCEHAQRYPNIFFNPFYHYPFRVSASFSHSLGECRPYPESYLISMSLTSRARFFPFGTISVTGAAVPRETRVHGNLDRAIHESRFSYNGYVTDRRSHAIT